MTFLLPFHHLRMIFLGGSCVRLAGSHGSFGGLFGSSRSAYCPGSYQEYGQNCRCRITPCHKGKLDWQLLLDVLC